MTNNYIRIGDFSFHENIFPCSCCKLPINKTKDESAVMLQCGHALHYECLNKIILDTFGYEMFIVTIDKKKIWNSLRDEKYCTMTFGTNETNGFIVCPHEDCEVKYSILSPIYKQFGIPKKIDNIVLFANNTNELLLYHLCTNIDLIHLLDYDLQFNMLQNFNYENESKLFDKSIEERPEIMMLGKYDDFVFHAVMVEGCFAIFPDESCPACKAEKNEIDDIFDYEHASIADYLNFINPRKFEETPPISPKNNTQ